MEQLELPLGIAGDQQQAEHREREFHFILGDFAHRCKMWGTLTVLDALYDTHPTLYREFEVWFGEGAR